MALAIAGLVNLVTPYASLSPGRDAYAAGPGDVLSSDRALTFYAKYTNVSAAAGEDIVIDVNLVNDSKKGEDVDLTVPKAPTGWTTRIRPQFTTLNISSIYAEPGKTQNMELRITPPKGTASGNYTVTLQASSKDKQWVASSDIAVQITGSAPSQEGVSLSTDYPTLSGSSRSKFQFTVNLVNTGPQDRTYDLKAKAPARWSISITPSYDTKEISTVSVKAGQSQGLAVSLTPPFDVDAGDFTTTFAATSGNIQNSVDLKVTIVGTYKMTLSTSSGRLNTDIVAGQESDMTMIVANNGTAPLQGITLSANKPDGWTVTFSPDRIDSLASAKQLEISVKVKAASNAIPGDYAVSLKASNDQASESMDIRASTTAPTVWGFVGIAIIVIVVGGLGAVFVMMGRR